MSSEMDRFKDVLLMQVIRTNILTLGTGVKDDPYRRVTQYWSLDGELLAQIDPTDKPKGES